MDDENSLELSLGLGLSCGGSTGKSIGNTSDPDGAEGSKSKEMVGNFNVSEVTFNHFFPTSADNQDQIGQQRHESFWTNLGKHPVPEADGPRFRELWISDNKAADVTDENSGLSKRKMPFEGTNLHKKPEIGSDNTDIRGKSPNNMVLKSHVSVNTEDGSYAENEDVAESEADGPTSWLMSQPDEHGKGSDTSKSSDKLFLSNSSVLNSQGKNQPNAVVHEANNQNGKFNFGVPFSVHSMPTTVSLPAADPNAANVHNMTGIPSHAVVQLLPLADDNQSREHSLNSSNLHAFGYPFVQLPTLESGSWMLGSNSQCVQSYDRKNTSDGLTKAAHHGVQLKTSHASASEGNMLDLSKGNGKDNEEVLKHSTSQKEGEANGSKSIFKQNDVSNQITAEGLPGDSSTIRPGVAPGLKFGGSGSCPDLPWVTTTGRNGKTISGVTYKYGKNQIRIVCACHGTHMSPEEFIQHASVEAEDAEINTAMASFPSSSNAAASAQS